MYKTNKYFFISKYIRERFSDPFLILCKISKTFIAADYVKQQHFCFASLFQISQIIFVCICLDFP